MVGFYRYKDVFQIYPSDELPLPVSGQPITIEYNDKYRLKTDVEEKRNVFEEGYGHLDFLNELIALLQIAANSPCDLIRNELNIRPGVQEKIDGFRDVSSLGLLELSNERIFYRQNPGSLFVALQKQTDEFLDNYFRLNESERNRVSSTLLLHQKMRKIILISASMGLVGMISSIENLVYFQGEREGFVVELCSECSTERYKVTGRFMKFMKKHSEKKLSEKLGVKGSYITNPDYSNGKVDDIIRELYTQRSKIAHAGKILELDRKLSEFSMKDVMLFNEVEALTRIAIFSFLINYDFSLSGKAY